MPFYAHIWNLQEILLKYGHFHKNQSINFLKNWEKSILGQYVKAKTYLTKF